MGRVTVTSVYKPPTETFAFTPPQNFDSQTHRLIIGDFNSHNTSWGYSETDNNGEAVEEWCEGDDFSLIHDSKLPYSFQSKIWKRGYNPDLCFASQKVADLCVKRVYDPIPKTQHRPIGLEVYAAVKTPTIFFRRRFNFKKANWSEFAKMLDQTVSSLEPIPENYEQFTEILKEISRKTIPRGCRTQYIAGLSNNTKDLLNEYTKLYERDPFSEDTINCGIALVQQLSSTRQEKWVEKLESLDMTHSSKIAWNFIKKLNGDPVVRQNSVNVTPNQVAQQLLKNGKTEKRIKTERLQRDHATETNSLVGPFTVKEFNNAVNTMKNGKAAGEDDICTEQIKHFGSATKNWLLTLFNNCVSELKIPKLWRKSKVISLLKPGKDPESASSYRPISLLCHLFKVYERLILNRMGKTIEPKLIPQQAGFRPGKTCTGQVLALTEHIEKGFEGKLITGVAFVDLTAAFDTVNHKKLLIKMYNLTKDYKLTQVISSLLQNRRFYVVLNGKKSRWRDQRNGLPQGSVLSPTLFNIYTNDQPIGEDSKSFVYADDLGLAVQGEDFKLVEAKLEEALKKMATYYEENTLRPNPTKTQVSAFHLKNKQAGRRLKVRWQDSELEHTDFPNILVSH